MAGCSRHLCGRGGNFDADSALAVGAPDTTAAVLEQFEDLPARMAIAVVPSYRDNCQLRADGEQESRVARRTAVVGDLQKPCPEPLGIGEQVVLRRTFDVAGQQRDPLAPRGPQHD